MAEEQDSGGHINEDQRRAIRGLFAALPRSYEQLYAVLQNLREEFHLELGKALEPALRSEATRAPVSTHEERRALAWSIRHSAESLGLKTICPSSGRPLTLIAPETTDSGRFAFSVFDPSRGREYISSTFDALPPLNLGIGRRFDSDHVPKMFHGLGPRGGR